MAKVGRPRKIKSVRQFEERAEAYFRECEAKGEPALLTPIRSQQRCNRVLPPLQGEARPC